MNIRLLLSVSSAIALAACSQETATVSNQAASAASGAVSAASAPAAASAPVAITAAATAPAQVFNIESLPVSTVPLGQFPYFSLPANYKSFPRTDSVREYARFPFFVGDRIQMVEGKMYSTRFSYFVANEQVKQNYSSFEVEKNLESVAAQLGGAKVFGGKIPDDVRPFWKEALEENFPAAKYYEDDPFFAYVIRHNGGNIWIGYMDTDHYMGEGFLFVVQEKGFAATTKILDAGEMKKQIDSAGKVDLQVNFATDKTEILPESQPQIDEVFKLLQSDPALKLSINGHTDNTGGKAHNQSLSEGRAHSVVATLVGKGIAADRLKAAGFGDSRPIADNGTEEGKAKNRRVELVKQ
ncbi:OmpA family protein [Neisseria dentiae]|uniref:OmpA family protein n=1 Tax=Neisseria dentiae TaxID=194197 RepID=UPI0035A11C4D